MDYVHFATLGPEIKLFIAIVAIAGPVAIVALLALLKQIEAKSPEKIRWR